MSYDLNLYVKKIDDSIIPLWKEQLKEFGIIAEFHPEFTFNDQQGFLPFSIRFNNPKITIKEELLTGFEIQINDIERDEIYDLVDEGTKLPENLINDCKELFIAVRYLFRSVEKMDYYPDPIEFQIAWASSSILCNLLNGVLINPQVGGGTFTSENVKSQAKLEIEKLIDSLKPNEWEIHKFEGWS